MFGRKKRKEIVTTGIRARALITGIENTGVKINNNPRLKLTLQVQPGGEMPFVATKKVTITSASIPTVGSTIWVRYEPNDRSRIEVEEPESDSATARLQVNIIGVGTAAQRVTIDGKPLPSGPPRVTTRTVIDGGTTVIDARSVRAVRGAQRDGARGHLSGQPDATGRPSAARWPTCSRRVS